MKAIVNNSCCQILCREKLPRKTVGKTMEVEFSADWEGLAITAVFEAGDVKKDVVYTGEPIIIPHEVLVTEGLSVMLGFHGALPDGTIVKRTVPEWLNNVSASLDPSGENSSEPTPDWAAQVQAIATEAKKAADSVRSDADAGKFTGPAGKAGGFYTPAVTQPDENTMRVAFTPSKEGMPAVDPADIAIPTGGGSGTSGADGGYYTPEVTQTSENTMQVAFSPSKTSMPAVSGTEITLPAGQKGDKGDTGATGADGKSAYAYAVEGGYTGTEAEFAAKLAAEKFANPNALTFTGAVNSSYDGSAPLTVEIPSGGGGDGLSAFEKIGTIDLSTMAASNLGVEYTVTDVTEVVLVWTGMTNTTTSVSSLNVSFNGGAIYNTLGLRTGKAGLPLNGYTYLKVLEGVGLLPIIGKGAVSNTNYAAGGAELPYNLIPVKEKIQTLEIKQPTTQYYADAGIVEVYVR